MSRRRAIAPKATLVGAKYRPGINLVPEPIWQMNMRALMTRTEWRQLRLALLERQGLACATCGKEESLSRRLYAHEEWEYDEGIEPATARIRGVSLICWHCHALEHWGRTKGLVCSGALLSKAINDSIAHFCRVNDATEEDFKTHEADAFNIWARRCTRTWRIDYGIFADWTSKTFVRDPLNDEPWPPYISTVSQEGFQPNIEKVIAQISCPQRV